MKTIGNPLLKPALLIFALFVYSCSQLVTTFDQVSYSQTVALKVDALALMDKATDDYSSHLPEIAALQLELDKAVEYDKHRPKNDYTNKQWEILINPQGGLLGGFLVRWKDKKMKPVAVKDIETNVSAAFDQILELESGKMKPPKQ